MGSIFNNYFVSIGRKLASTIFPPSSSLITPNKKAEYEIKDKTKI